MQRSTAGRRWWSWVASPSAPPRAHISRRSAGSGRDDARACDVVKAQATLCANGILSRKGLPALDGDVDEAGLDLECVGSAPDTLRCQEGRSGPTEEVEHDVAATAAVPYRVCNQRDRLDRRMRLQLVQAARPERVDPGVMPDVGSRAAVAP